MARIPKQEQLAALLNAQTWQLAEKYCDSDWQELRQSLTVTLPELVDYAKRQGIPEGWFNTEPATRDGVYLVRRERRWAVYEQERGLRFDEVELDDYDAAFELVLSRYYLPR